MTAYIQHVTMATGHVRASPRSEVSEAVMTLMATWLDRALLTEQTTPIPTVDHSALVMSTPGGLVVTVYDPDGAPEALFGVARRSRGSERLWRELSGMGECRASRPQAPWIAVAPIPGYDLSAAGWLGDFERCVAWAWIERVAD